MRKLVRSLVLILTIGLAIGLVIGLDPAQSRAMAARPSPSPVGPGDPAEVRAFFDQQVPRQLRDLHVPGAVVTVVRDGKAIFTQGYGYADLARRAPFTAGTLFRAGSVTKLFTATAIMQLAERGKLDLNADVNTYLTGFKIPATYPRPITLASLLTHTSGFDPQLFGMATLSPGALEPLGQWLARNMPPRVRPPGQFSAYSNYGLALAGYIAQQVSGVPYDRYVTENILKPLGMTSTTVLQPPPAALAPRLASAYTYANGSYARQPFELYQVAPAGAITTSAPDMTHFMIAMLRDGCYQGHCVLRPASVLEMRRTWFRADPGVNGYALGFEEDSVNGQRVIGHGGKTFGFRTQLELLPGQDAGFLVSYNGLPDGMAASAQLFQAFMDHYYPAAPAKLVPSVGSAARIARFAGTYQWADIAQTTVDKVEGLLNPVQIGATSDGYLTFDGARFVQTGPLAFRQVPGTSRLVFRQDGQGNITAAFYDGDPESAFVRLGWYQDPSPHLLLLAISLLILLSGVVASMTGWVIRRLRKTNEPRSGLARLAAWTTAAVVLLDLLFLAGLTATVSDPNSYFLVGNVAVMRLVLTPPFLIVAITAAMIVITVLGWRNRAWRLPRRIHYTLMALSSLAFVLILDYWNLLGWRLVG